MRSLFRGDARNVIALVAAGSAAIALVMVSLWPALPPVHQDEYLPTLPLAWYVKPAQAHTALLASYTSEFFGLRVPVRAYAYVGAPKAFIYGATGVPLSVSGYRIANATGVAVLIATVSWTAYRLAGGGLLAAWLCLALLLGDTSLLVLGVTDEGPIVLDLLAAVALVALLHDSLARPRWWRALALAMAVLVGIWDRVNFLWYVGSGLGAFTLSSLTQPRRGRWRSWVWTLLGVAGGLAGVYAVVPQYLDSVKHGFDAGALPTSAEDLARHLAYLIKLGDPFSAYHRYVEVNLEHPGGVYLAYRVAICALFAITTAAGLAVGLARLRDRREDAATPLYLGLFLLGLVAAITLTTHAWASHHIVVIKPFLYLTLAYLVSELGRGRILCAGLSVALALFFAYTGYQGLAELRVARPLRGLYGVTWNAVDAWRAAVASEVESVYVLDWGVFYPGLANSRPLQRWENARSETLEDVSALTHGRADVLTGLLFNLDAGHAWVAARTRRRTDRIVSTRTFSDHRGDRWGFQVIHARKSPRSSPSFAVAAQNLVEDPSFGDKDAKWKRRVAGANPDSVEISFPECGSRGLRCARLVNRAPADSWLIQDVVLDANTTYEISTEARSEGVSGGTTGVQLSLVGPSGIHTADLRGDSGWRRLRIFVSNGDKPASVGVAVRLGDYGQLATGAGWFTAVDVHAVAQPSPGAPSFELDAQTIE